MLSLDSYETVQDTQSDGTVRIDIPWPLSRQTCWPERSDYGKLAPQGVWTGYASTSVPASQSRSYVRFDSVNSKSVADRDNFKQIRASRTIKFTPWHNSRIDTHNFLARVPRYVMQETFQAPAQYHQVGDQYCDPHIVADIGRSESSWSEVGDLSYWKETYPTSVHIKAPEISLDRDINAVMSSVVSDNLKTHDLMTDLFEARSTFNTALQLLSKVRRPLQSFKEARDILRSKGATHKSITELWLQYRYAIMPVIYGLEDAARNLEQAIDIYKTSRKKRTVSRDFNGRPSFTLDSVTFYDIVEGETVIRGTGKARYHTFMHRLLDQTSFNTANALWEVIPYSLVVDWVSNMGEWIHIHTALMADFSSQRKFCYSIKDTYTVNTYLLVKTKAVPAVKYSRTKGPVSISMMGKAINATTTEQLVRSVVHTSYRRVLYNPSSVELGLDVQFSNWKRWIDGYALSLTPILKSLKRLR